MSSLPQARYTPEQYLEIDHKADQRSEYVNGEILAMAGTSREHNLIVTNLVREVSLCLRGRPCETYSSDMQVEVSPVRCAYPDVVVACGQPEFRPGQLDTLLNPTVIVEVLSPTTAADDRSWKFAHYRWLETLTDYVMLSQYQPFVEHYTRQGEQWMLTEVAGLEAVLRLAAIACDLPLSLVYERVEFAPDPEMPALEFWNAPHRKEPQ